MKQEQYEASENIQKFFIKILELKHFVKERLMENQDNDDLKEIYDRLNNIIKIENNEDK